MIQLISNGDGTLSEPGTDVTWVPDAYTEPRETVFNCDDCGGQITEWYFWTCMDGGEAAHTRCVTVVPLPFPVSIDPSPAAPGPAWEWPEDPPDGNNPVTGIAYND